MTPPPLSGAQKQRLQVLEPSLRNAVRLGDYENAKRLTSDIQAVLQPTGHTTRIMQAKTWLFEAAMEASQLTVAMSGFHGIRAKVTPTTRVYLEATALLAICHLRRKEIAEAEPFMAEVLRKDHQIISEKRRRQFRMRIIRKFEEETLLAGLTGGVAMLLDVDRVQAEAGRTIQTQTEDEILINIGREVPPEVVALLLRVHEFASRQLPAADLKFLPPARTLTEKVSLGRSVYDAVARVAWRSLCDTNSDVYKLWFQEGVMAVINRKSLTVAVVAALSGFKVGSYAIAVAIVAMVLKAGLEVFCEVARPQSVMIHLSEK